MTAANTESPSAVHPAIATWISRVRILAAIAIVWGGLHFVLDQSLLPVGFRRPATVLIGDGGLVPAIAMLLLVTLGTAIASFLVPRRDASTAILVVGVALALWAIGRGNIDDWLVAQTATPGPAGGAPYWPLLPEHALTALLLLAILAVSHALQPADGDAQPPSADASRVARATWICTGAVLASDALLLIAIAVREQRAFASFLVVVMLALYVLIGRWMFRTPPTDGRTHTSAVPQGAPPGQQQPTTVTNLFGRLFGSTPAARAEGPPALVLTAAIGAIGLIMLSGPLVGPTRRGQVYFALVVGFLAGAAAARRLCPSAAPFWFYAAPLLTGITGVLIAAILPGVFLGPSYSQLNVLPAIGLVRPLPIELLSVGLVAVCWGLHMSHAGAGNEGQRS